MNLLVDPNKLKNLKNQDQLKKVVQDFYDESFIELARNNGKIKVAERQFVPVLRVYAKGSNKAIKVSEESLDNGDVIKIFNNKGNTVKDANNRVINVDVEKTIKNSAYEKNYTPRYLTEKARDLLEKNKKGFRVFKKSVF